MPEGLRILATQSIAALGLAIVLGVLVKPDVPTLEGGTATLPPQGPNGVGSPGDPTLFSPEELRTLQQRFGVHGPQTPLAQLLTRGVDQLQPLRTQTLDKIKALKPVIVREAQQHHLNPMLLTAILFDEIQHSKPGEDLPFIVHSGFVKTHGPAQIGISELIHQKMLPENPSDEDIAWARDILLDPNENVIILAGKIQRLKRALGLPTNTALQASRNHLDTKAIATLAYLHNGKLDYPARVLHYMQDPELHGVIYSTQTAPSSWLI